MLNTLKRATGVALVSALFLVMVLGTGCTKMATQEQLDQLEALRDEALGAEAVRDSLRREKADLEAQIAQKQAELQAVQQEKEKVAQRLKERQAKQAAEMQMEGGGK